MDQSGIFTGYVVPIVAILGLSLSIYNTYIQLKRNRPNISLDISYWETMLDPNYDEIKHYDCYVVNAKNLGNVDVIVASVGFKWDNKIFERDYSSITDQITHCEYEQLPFQLKPGSRLFIEFFKREILKEISKSGISGLIEVTFYIKDGNGKLYTSAPIKIESQVT